MKFKENSPSTAMPEPLADFADDAARLDVLESYGPDALEDDPELAEIVRFAAHLCDVPVSQVTLVEEVRQRFLVREGIEERETPREIAFCAHTLGRGAILEVQDASADPRFAANPLVTGWPEVRFYAGQPLVSPEGASLGTLCVIDLKPRPEGLTAFQREGMAVLAQAVMRRLNARRDGIRAREAILEREQRLQRMIEGVPQIAWSADNLGNFDYFNQRWQQTTGAPPPKLTEDWRTFIHADDHEEAFGAWAQAFANGEMFESEYRLLQADGSWRWVLGQAHPVAEGPDHEQRWFGTITDIDEAHRLSESRDLLSKELAHRIRNIFAVVTGLTMLKARAAPEHLEFAEELSGALRSLSSAHSFVKASGAPLEENLHALLASLFLPYADGQGQARVQISGADCAISARAATPIALVFHELATNSAKYGALSRAEGEIHLVIADNDDTVVIDWREVGGPAVADNGKRGFGTRLVEMTVKGQLQGSWTRSFPADGLEVELRLARHALTG